MVRHLNSYKLDLSANAKFQRILYYYTVQWEMSWDLRYVPLFPHENTASSGVPDHSVSSRTGSLLSTLYHFQSTVPLRTRKSTEINSA